MNRAIYEALERELSQLNLEALPTKSQIGRIQEIESELEEFKELYELSTNLSVWDIFTRELADQFCQFMIDPDDDIWFRDVTYAIPLWMDINEPDYPIGETLLIIRWPEGWLYDMISCLMIDENEYEVIYIYNMN